MTFHSHTRVKLLKSQAVSFVPKCLFNVAYLIKERVFFFAQPWLDYGTIKSLCDMILSLVPARYTFWHCSPRNTSKTNKSNKRKK